jgi:hypothetical protein
MTVDERVNDFMARGILCGAFANKEVLPNVHSAIKSAISAAVQEEREALAGRFEAAAQMTTSTDAAEAYRRAVRMIRARTGAG